MLDAYVDAVIQETGAEQVDLIGHSAGAGLTREYVGEMGAGKVRKLKFMLDFILIHLLQISRCLTCGLRVI